MSRELAGRCGCGVVRFRLDSEPMFVNCCHCLDCQRQTGSAFVINALIETDRVKILAGEVQPYLMPTDSGRPHRIFRCTRCQTAMWSEYGGFAPMRFVRVGTLEDPTALTPDVHVYTRSKLPWVSLHAGAKAFAEYYDAKAEWPAASLARRQALIDALRKN